MKQLYPKSERNCEKSQRFRLQFRIFQFTKTNRIYRLIKDMLEELLDNRKIIFAVSPKEDRFILEITKYSLFNLNVSGSSLTAHLRLYLFRIFDIMSVQNSNQLILIMLVDKC